jgi:hypothetical protein
MHGARIPIWFFIGLLLTLYGAMIFFAGVAEWASGQYPPGVELNNLHAPVWWGGLLALLGVFYLIRFRPGRSGK